jgi:phosphopantothenoylcysteine decarboxylase / phosphopantothenate---cysteine ligase
MQGLRDKNIILGVTGGIAAYKSADLVRRLRDAGALVRVVMTGAARQFISPLTLQALSGFPVRVELLDSEAESGMDHIELARWADMVVVAPATADFIAKLDAGIADELLSTLCLATEAPIVIAPAMNRVMWSKTATQRNLSRLKADGVHVIAPADGAQACGETGAGRLPETPDIIARLATILDPGDPRLMGRRIMITAGPTWESIDPVRGITNHSSGKMGYALADAFQRGGASVTLISGPCRLEPPPGTHLIRVVSAMEMYHAVHETIAEQSIFIGVAAVADYRPQSVETEKIKKQQDEMTLTLVRNPDIIASVTALEEAPFCVGFAAETNDMENHARGKLVSKRLDMIAANLVGQPGTGFNSDINTLLVMDSTGSERLGPATKTELAEMLRVRITDRHEEKHSTQDS